MDAAIDEFLNGPPASEGGNGGDDGGSDKKKNKEDDDLYAFTEESINIAADLVELQRGAGAALAAQPSAAAKR